MTMTPNIGNKIVAGAIWMVAARWSMRLIGVVSTIILARLLSPEDFGIVAVSMIVIGLIEVLANAGLSQSIVRSENPDDAHFNTVWTLQIILSTIVAFTIFLIAPLAATYFDNENVTPVLQLLSLRSFIQGFENPGIIWFRKNMDFHKDFQFLVLQRFIRFFAVVILAILLRDYWALVYATLFGRSLTVLLSYIMHPFRPKPDLSKTREIWGFSLWLLISQFGHFVNARIDAIFLGGAANTTAVGGYTVAADIAQSPTQELVAPLSRVLFSAFSKVQSNAKRMEALFLKSFSSVATLCFATGAGVALISEDVTHVVLGQKWLVAEPVLFWLGLTSIIQALTVSMTTMMNSLGLARASAMVSWSRLLFVVPVLIQTAPTGDIGLVSFGRFCVIAALLLPVLYFFSVYTKVSSASVLKQLVRPSISTLAMAGALLAIDHFMRAPDLSRILIKVSLGALVYSLSTYLLWIGAGRPSGMEGSIDEEVRKLLIKMKAK